MLTSLTVARILARAIIEHGEKMTGLVGVSGPDPVFVPLDEMIAASKLETLPDLQMELEFEDTTDIYL